MQVKRIYALIAKEFLQISRDPSTLLIAFVLPMILLFMYGYGISLDITQMKLGCVLEDRGQEAEGLMQGLSHSPLFSISYEHNNKQMGQKIAEGKLLGGIVIPSYFSKFLESGKAPIFVIADGSQPNTANFVYNYFTGALENFLTEQREEEQLSPPPSIQVVPRFWYNEELNSHYFLIPGSIAIIMTLIGTILTALVIAREWERGTMEALMATPLKIGEILIGKLVPYFLLGLVSLVVCTFLGCFVFGVPLRAGIGSLTLVSSLFLMVSLATGLLISLLTKNQFHASQIAIVSAFLPAFMLSGFIFEISSMPDRIQWLTYLMPARYMVSSLQTLFLVGDVPALFAKNCLVLTAFACILSLILFNKSSKRLE